MLESLTVFIEQTVQSSLGTAYIAIPVFLVAGVASSLFPCYYPLIPVTAGFLQKRSEEGEARWKHPLIYWAGTVITYAILGSLAALGGGAFNTIMQSGPVILLTGFLFLYLAAAMMDWASLTFGAERFMQKASGHSGATFTLFMGMGAGLIASACVAPALVALLVFIAEAAAREGLSAATIGYGSLLSTAYGVGIGLPLFTVGVIGASLPKSGGWMLTVKYSFATLIGIVAVFQLIQGFTVMGFSTMEINLILFGLALLIAGALLGLKPPETSDRPAVTKFAFALIFVILGASLTFSGINFFSESATSSGANGAMGSNPDEEIFEEVGNLHFHRNPNPAFEQARTEGKPIFVDFYADWCSNCKDFERLALRDERLNNALSEVVLIKIHDVDPVFDEYMNDPKYPELRIGLPFYIVFTPDGDFHWKSSNYRDTEGMIQALNEAAET